MPKRFTESLKWEDPWFCGLSLELKLFWLYLLDKCDHAGIWKVNEPLVKFHLGASFEVNPVALSGRVVPLSADKWFIPKFVAFQYGTLNPANRVHKVVLQILKKEGALTDRLSPVIGAKDKEQAKAKEYISMVPFKEIMQKRREETSK